MPSKRVRFDRDASEREEAVYLPLGAEGQGLQPRGHEGQALLEGGHQVCLNRKREEDVRQMTRYRRTGVASGNRGLLIKYKPLNFVHKRRYGRGGKGHSRL